MESVKKDDAFAALARGAGGRLVKQVVDQRVIEKRARDASGGGDSRRAAFVVAAVGPAHKGVAEVGGDLNAPRKAFVHLLKKLGNDPAG